MTCKTCSADYGSRACEEWRARKLCAVQVEDQASQLRRLVAVHYGTRRLRAQTEGRKA